VGGGGGGGGGGCECFFFVVFGGWGCVGVFLSVALFSTTFFLLLDVKPGQYIESPMPRPTTILLFFVDEMTNPGALWV